MLLALQLTHASAIANQGLRNMSGYPFKFNFGCSTRKLMGYYQELIETMASSIMPSASTIDLSTS